MAVKLSDAYAGRYQALLEAVASRLPGRRLACFWPQIGGAYECGTDWLFVGQAVNGWGSRRDGTWLVDGAAPTVDDVRDYSESLDSCDSHALSWIERSDTRSKPFWSTIRWLAAADDDAWEHDWSPHVAWSNLYKIAPSEGGNPDAALRAVQFECCRDLLLREIDELKPACVVMMAGVDWFDGFVPLDRRTARRLARDPLAVVATQVGGTPAVLSPHPAAAFRGRVSGEELGTKIWAAIRRLKAR